MKRMNQLLLALSLSFAGGAVMAEPVKLPNSDLFRSGTLYTDPALNKKEGSIVTFTIITEYDNPLGFRKGAAYSHVDKSAYDCEKMLTRSLVDIHYDGHMGKGNVVQSYESSGDWNKVNPGTRGEQDWKAACGKK